MAISKFKAYFYYGLGFWNTGTICSSFGFATDNNPSNVNIKMDYNLINCYKTVFNDLSDLSGPWSANKALYIDSCEPSFPQEIILDNFELFPQATPYSFWGGDPTGVNQPGCFKFG